MFCKNCGKKLSDEDKFCSACGKPVDNEKEEVETKKEEYRSNRDYYDRDYFTYEPSFENQTPEEPTDAGSFWWGVLGFFIPLVGLIIFLLWRTEKPVSSKQAGIGALIGVILGVAFFCIVFCCIGSGYGRI